MESINDLANLVDKAPDGCWLWPEYVHATGYGHIRHDGGYEAVHRYVYRQFSGPIPNGFVIHHECQVRNCVNPEHLVALSPSEHSSCEHLMPGAFKLAQSLRRGERVDWGGREVITFRGLFRLHRIDPSQVLRWIREERVEACKPRHQWLVDIGSLCSFLMHHRATCPRGAECVV